VLDERFVFVQSSRLALWENGQKWGMKIEGKEQGRRGRREKKGREEEEEERGGEECL
jgi:hypothetical protein